MYILCTYMESNACTLSHGTIYMHSNFKVMQSGNELNFENGICFV